MNTIVSSRLAMKEHNSSQRINRLPLEILSQVFLMGHELELPISSSNVRPASFEEDDLCFQERIAQVCRHWRTVAINMPQLWSHIELRGPSPHCRIELFLSRTKPDTALHIDLDMRDFFMLDIILDPTAQSERAIETLERIIDSGGNFTRWVSLKVSTHLPRVVLAVVEFISAAPLNRLVFLELAADCYNADHPVLGTMTDDALEGRDPSKATMFHQPPPRLQTLNLTGFPTLFMFVDPAVSLVSGLTRLELNTIYILPPLRGMYNLFLSNPTLEYLALDMSGVILAITSMSTLQDCVADLPQLRYLSIVSPFQTSWTMAILAMIDAPEVETLKLDFQHASVSFPPGIVTQYLSKGREYGRLLEPTFGDTREMCGPIYPNLRRLSIGSFPDQGHYLGTLLQSLPKLTRIDWELGESCDKALLALADTPLVCPQLQHLRVHGVSNDELLEVVRSRIKRGRPLNAVDVSCCNWDMINASTKRYLKSVLGKFSQYTGKH